MKKIGLVTVTYVNNYGSHLQSFALQEKLKNEGFIPEIINIESARKDINRRRRHYVVSRILNFSEMRAYIPIVKRKIALRFDKEYHYIYVDRVKQFKVFSESHYDIAKKVEGWAGLATQCKESFSAVVVGSDQNWRPANIAGGYYTLEFVPDDVNKIAYATSFGLDHVIPQQKEKARFFLSRINHLSVREDSGRRIVEELLHKDIPVVCDPTLLLSASEWDVYIPSDPIVKGKYIFCYFLGANKEYWGFVKKLKAETGLKIVGIPYGEQYVKGVTSYIDEIPQNIGPFEFVNLIKNASFICTDSFHGCAFSINYNKNVFAFYKFTKRGTMSTNNRIDSMFKWIGMQNQIIKSPGKFDLCMLKDVDYSDANKRLEAMRTSSIKYLLEALKVQA